MKTWFVTRHDGAVKWAAKSGIKTGDKGVVKNLEVEKVSAGDKVVGNLPVHLVAQIIEKGGEYFHLSMELEEQARGKELTAEEMDKYGARIEQFYVANLGKVQSAAEFNQNAEQIMLVITSGQSLPNILPFLCMQPSISHLFLAISGSKEAISSARKVTSAAKLKNIKITEFKKTPDAPLKSVQSFASECYRKMRNMYPAARIILNATGGTKMMSAGFANALGPAGEIVYCDTNNEQIEFLSPQNRAALPLRPDLLSLEMYFLSQGIEINSVDSSNEKWLAEVKRRASLTRAIVNELDNNSYVAERTIQSLNILTSAIFKEPKFDFNLPLSMKSGIFDNQIEALGLWRRIDSRTIKVVGEAEAKYLAGGWLEEFAALTMLDMDVPREHWGVGVKIRPKNRNPDEEKKDKPELNELDLAIVWRNRLLVVECKTGMQISKDPQVIINKAEAIRSYAGGSLGTSWILSARSIDKPIARERAKEYRITIHEREAIAVLRQYIAEWMRLPLDADSSTALKENIKRRDKAKQKNNIKA